MLPAGPSVADEIAGAAFLVGLIAELPHVFGDIPAAMPFDDARANFFAAARFGLDAQLRWPGLGMTPAARLVCDHLIPIARAGLRRLEVDRDDADERLSIVAERSAAGRTGAAWTLASLQKLSDAGVPAERRAHALTAAALKLQEGGAPVHLWPLAEDVGQKDSFRAAYRTVGQFMTTDLRTVRPSDLLDLAAALMDWIHVRHVPVEDDDGRLVGILSHRVVVRLFAMNGGRPTGPVAVSSVMTPDPITVSPDTNTLDAVRLMREKKIGALPVTEGGRLVGIVTEHDFIKVAQGLLEERLRD